MSKITVFMEESLIDALHELFLKVEHQKEIEFKHICSLENINDMCTEVKPCAFLRVKKGLESCGILKTGIS